MVFDSLPPLILGSLTLQWRHFGVGGGGGLRDRHVKISETLFTRLSTSHVFPRSFSFNKSFGNSWFKSTDRVALLKSWEIIRSGQANFLLKSANRKSANSRAHSTIANLQISTKYHTTLPQNSPKSRFFKTILLFCINLNYSRALYALFVRRKSMYMRTCGGLSP